MSIDEEKCCHCMSIDDEKCYESLSIRKEYSNGNRPFDTEIVNNKLLKFGVVSGLPFSFVEWSGNIAVWKYLNPQFSPPSKATIADIFKYSYKREIAELKKCFQSLHGHVSITMGWWSDLTTSNYVCLVAHYIDNDWKLRKRLINFRPTPFPFEESEFCETLSSCLTNWNIKKLFSIAVDNSVAKVVTPLQLKSKLHLFTEPGFNLHDIPCHADIFTLLAREALDSTKGSLEVIRYAVQCTRREGIESMFYEIANEMKVNLKKRLYLDPPFLWHSTYLMLENTLRFQEVFLRLESIDPSFTENPSHDDWVKARSLTKFLKLYYNAAKLFSDKNTTADMYFYETWKLCMHLKSESKNSDPFISSLAIRMKDIFDEYWNSCFLILAIATVFNPMHKMLMVDFCLQNLLGNSSSADPYVMLVRDGIQKLYDEYDSLPLKNVDNDDASSTSSNGDRDQNDDTFMADYEEFCENYYLGRPLKSELEIYLEEKVYPLGDSTFDILTFWRLNQFRFPKLARIARDVLAIPIFSRGSDSVFRIGDRVLEERYISADPLTLEGRICMQNWLQEASSCRNIYSATILDGDLFFNERNCEEDEEEEAEGNKNEEGKGNDDEEYERVKKKIKVEY